jgi:hypothetical protein
LRHQLRVLERSRPHGLPLTRADRLLWIWLSYAWTEWRAALVIVKPETVIAWHRQGFGLFWTWKSRRRAGRPKGVVGSCPPGDLGERSHRSRSGSAGRSRDATTLAAGADQRVDAVFAGHSQP